MGRVTKWGRANRRERERRSAPIETTLKIEVRQGAIARPIPKADLRAQAAAAVEEFRKGQQDGERKD